MSLLRSTPQLPRHAPPSLSLGSLGVATRVLNPSMTNIITLVLLATFAVSNLFAESPVERELKLLRDQRDKAIASASEPINRRYQASLEQMLRRAMQSNDLDGALKIKQEMGVVTPPAATAPATASVHKRYRYEFAPQPSTLPEAVEIAKTAGGIVAMPKNSEEMETLVQLAAKNRAGQVLLGATRTPAADGVWTCSDGSTLDPKFAAKIGNLADLTRTSLRLGDGRALFTIPHDAKLPFFIAIPK